MIKCPNCNSYKVSIKLKDEKFMIINECFNCFTTIHLFIDDYINNYKEFCSFCKKDKISELCNCSKHSQIFAYFCHNCKEILCEECILSHDSKNHSIEKIKEIINDKDKIEIVEYKKDLVNLKNLIEKKIDEIHDKNEEFLDMKRLLNSVLNLILIKNYFLDIKFDKDRINVYELDSVKFLLDRHNKVKINLLIKSIQNGTFPSKNEINNYKNCIFYSFKSITKDKIINYKIHNWGNHIIQLKNGNILISTWDTLLLFKINTEKKCLDLIKTMHINNGSINHMYEYKKNKILCCDNQMKILQLNEENTSYKILFIQDYGRKIIPFLPYDDYIKIKSFNKFLLTATPNGIKVYSYLDNEAKDCIENQIEEEIINDIKYLGEFSNGYNGYDYSSIIQVKNKICGIYKNKTNYSDKNHFVVWEIEFDFNSNNFSKNKFNLLGEIKNIGAGIGRYSITNVNNKYVLVGIMKNSYYIKDARNNGIKIISLETVEIVQYIHNYDEIMSIITLRNGVILTGGHNILERKYFIRQFKFDEKDKELLLVGSIQLHNDFINYIDDLKDGIFMSCGRDGNIFLVYY